MRIIGEKILEWFGLDGKPTEAYFEHRCKELEKSIKNKEDEAYRRGIQVGFDNAYDRLSSDINGLREYIRCIKIVNVESVEVKDL